MSRVTYKIHSYSLDYLLSAVRTDEIREITTGVLAELDRAAKVFTVIEGFFGI
ncbi:MAG: hypothetical protein O6940_10765 [Ignavibacteria bacterium]|nr:hypothetical protein [Ignavibacteria bacterium]